MPRPRASDPDFVDKCGADPRVSLWMMVIITAMSDALGLPRAVTGGNSKRRECAVEAIKWLRADTVYRKTGVVRIGQPKPRYELVKCDILQSDFHEVCSFAGLDPYWVRDGIRKMLIAKWGDCEPDDIDFTNIKSRGWRKKIKTENNNNILKRVSDLIYIGAY